MEQLDSRGVSGLLQPGREGTERLALLRSLATPAGYIVVIALGLVLRLSTLTQYTSHIDEPASLLALKRVSETGYPTFPSGVLYLQGALFSYLAAPLAWFFDDTALLDASRLLYMGIALAVIPLAMKLAQELTGSIPISVFVGVLVACDPNLIIWGLLIRPYGMLAAETVALLLLFVTLYKHGPDSRLMGVRVVYWIPVVAALGTYTHIGFWLASLPLALSAVAIWKTSLLGTHRAILFSGAASLIPLVVFLLLGRFVGSGSGTTDGAVGGAFVGSHVFTLEYLENFTDVRWPFWTGNFFTGSFHEMMPYLITFASGLLAYALIHAREHEQMGRWRGAVGTLLLTHWLIIFSVVWFVFDYPGGLYPNRYLHQVLPLGYLLIGLAAWTLWQSASRLRRGSRLLVGVGILAVIVAPALTHVSTAAAWRMEFPGGSADYWGASAWVADQMEPGQLVLTAMPPSAYFWFSDQQWDGLRFLAGPADGLRSRLYIKPNASGQPGDYWLGVPSIGSIEHLCSTITEHAGRTWMIVDDGRLNLPWGFEGPMQTIITGSSEERYRGHRDVVALFVKPVDAWTDDARAACGL